MRRPRFFFTAWFLHAQYRHALAESIGTGAYEVVSLSDVSPEEEVIEAERFLGLPHHSHRGVRHCQAHDYVDIGNKDATMPCRMVRACCQFHSFS